MLRFVMTGSATGSLHRAAALARVYRAARMIRASHDLQLNTGMLIAVPIPAAHAAEGAVIQQAIEESLKEADERGVAGAEVRGGHMVFIEYFVA